LAGEHNFLPLKNRVRMAHFSRFIKKTVAIKKAPTALASGALVFVE